MKKIALLSLLVIALSLVFTGVALAATPQDIYDDWAADGDLDGTYTEAELRAYLNDATVHQYGDPQMVNTLDRKVNELLTREEFPFTGAQIALMAIAVIALLGGGVALRRFAGARS